MIDQATETIECIDRGASLDYQSSLLSQASRCWRSRARDEAENALPRKQKTQNASFNSNCPHLKTPIELCSVDLGDGWSILLLVLLNCECACVQ